MITWLERGFQKLNPIGTRDSNGGYTRLGYSTEEALAFIGFMDLAKELGMPFRRDEAGNVIATWEGKNPSLPVIAIGSHVDTVKNGGAYDGAAGVLAGLGLVKALKQEGFVPNRSIEVIAFACEESSRFGVATIGSKAMVGLLDPDKVFDLEDEQGVTFRQAFASQSLDLYEVGTALRDRGEIHTFVELHIEQGAVLEETGNEIGVVLGIASPLRFQIRIVGKAGHTGTTPMGKRKDALAAAGRLITFVEETGELQAMRDHLVATVSVVRSEPNVMNVIPETVVLGIDLRSINNALKAETGQLIRNFCRRLEEQRGLNITIKELGDESAVHMDSTVIEQLMESCERSNKRFMPIVSGAGHDAMNMAYRWPTGMIFIPCRNGVSHHPDEYAEMADIQKGIEVLVEFVKRLEEEEPVR